MDAMGPEAALLYAKLAECRVAQMQTAGMGRDAPLLYVAAARAEFDAGDLLEPPSHRPGVLARFGAALREGRLRRPVPTRSLASAMASEVRADGVAGRSLAALPIGRRAER